MEAMSCGLPVIASRLSGIPELVEDGASGILVEPGDASALASAIARLAANAETRERMGASARERVVRDFDLTTNAATVLARIDRADTRPSAASAPERVGRLAEPGLTAHPTTGEPR